MKSKLIALSLLAVITLTGCVSPTKPDVQEQLRQLAADVRDISEAATVIALVEKPSNRDEIESVILGLKALEATPDPITMASLRAVLMKLPFDKLVSEKGQLYILGARIILRRAAYEVDLGSVTTMRPFVTAIREGMEAGTP